MSPYQTMTYIVTAHGEHLLTEKDRISESPSGRYQSGIPLRPDKEERTANGIDAHPESKQITNELDAGGKYAVPVKGIHDPIISNVDNNRNRTIIHCFSCGCE